MNQINGIQEQMTREQENEIIQEVRERYPEVPFPNIYQSPLFYGKQGNKLVDGRTAIVGWTRDAETGEVHEIPFSFPTKQYKLVRHETAIKTLELSLKDLPDHFGNPSVVPFVYDNGSKLSCRVRFPDIEVDIKQGDLVNPQVNMFNSYDMQKMFGIDIEAYQLVCSNGMKVLKAIEGMKQRHVPQLDVESIVGMITEGLERFDLQTGLWKRYADKQLEGDLFADMWEAIPFGSRHKDKILELEHEQTGETLQAWMDQGSVNAWNFHNVLTQFLTHEVESETVRNEKLDQVESLFYQSLKN